jgi:hypothetical protein
MMNSLGSFSVMSSGLGKTAARSVDMKPAPSLRFGSKLDDFMKAHRAIAHATEEVQRMANEAAAEDARRLASEAADAEAQRRVEKLRTLGDVPIFFDDGASLPVACLIGDLYEKGAQNIEQVAGNWPLAEGQRTILDQTLEELTKEKIMLQSGRYYGISREAEPILKSAFPDLGLPEKGKTYDAHSLLMKRIFDYATNPQTWLPLPEHGEW